MKRISVILALLSLIFVVFGCGGGGSDNSTPSPFAGRWLGNWNSAALSQNGTADVTIATNGALTGTIHNNQSGSNGTESGSISNAGQVSGTAQYPGQQATSISGTMTINGQGHLVGNLVQRINNTNYDVSSDLVKQ